MRAAAEIVARLILGMRLLGVTMRQRPLWKLAQDLRPWTSCSLILILTTCALLFIAESMRNFESTPFRIKMVLLAVALVFHYTVSRRSMNREREFQSLTDKAAAVFAIALWISVSLAGRAIALF